MKKLIIISLLTAMSYGTSCETSIKAMFNSGKRATAMYSINKLRSCQESERMWYHYESAQADCIDDKLGRETLKDVGMNIRSIYIGTCADFHK